MIKISVCIPAYNRHEFIEPLLNSILVQDYEGLDIIICEDVSPEREKIKQVVEQFIIDKNLDKSKIKYYENEKNLGYDKNFRELLEKATGEYCLFMGNDDILASGAIERILNVLNTNPEVAVISRAYQWFLGESNNIQDTIRHLPEDKLFEPGIDAIRFFYRRVGVLSGLVFKRKNALEIATDRFDGHLFYQMYVAGTLVKSYQAYYISSVQTLSRDGIEPDFGNAEVEKEKFKPGSYLYEGRVHMVRGLLKIANFIDDTPNKQIYKTVKKDIATYFYPYIRDQLGLPMNSYIKMLKEFMKLGMKNELYFYIHAVLGFVLKKDVYDSMIKFVRKTIGHTPRL